MSTATLCGILLPAEASQLADEEPALANHLQICGMAAVKSTQRLINSGTTGRTSDSVATPYRLDKLGAAKSVSPATSSASIFRDCGLPRVRRFADFSSDFLQNEVESSLHPFASVTDGVVRSLKPDVTKYNEHLHYLARLNYTKKPWLGRDERSWVQTFGSGLIGYMTELFSGRFVDRNGVRIQFDLGIDLTDFTRLDQIQLSPQVAGSLVTVLVEFLGDSLFGVPYYAPKVIEANRTYRSTAKSITEIDRLLELLSQSVSDAELTQEDADTLSIHRGGSLAWDPIVAGAPVASGLARLVEVRVGELDTQLLAAERTKAVAKQLLDQIDAGASNLQNRFTCHKTRVISDHIECLFLKDPANQGRCGRDRDTGRITGPTRDYSDLIGSFVAFAAKTVDRNVRAVTGGIVRGVSIFSLDNEVVAEVISAIAGTLAKKVIEKVSFDALVMFLESDGDLVEKRAFLQKLSEIHELLSNED